MGIEPAPNALDERLSLLEDKPVSVENAVRLLGAAVVNWNVFQLTPLLLDESIGIAIHMDTSKTVCGTPIVPLICI